MSTKKCAGLAAGKPQGRTSSTVHIFAGSPSTLHPEQRLKLGTVTQRGAVLALDDMRLRIPAPDLY